MAAFRADEKQAIRSAIDVVGSAHEEVLIVLAS
jgi:hypothetical protein